MGAPGERKVIPKWGVVLAVIVTSVLSAAPARAYTITNYGGTYTQGWDGPGLGSASIDWYLGWTGAVAGNNGLPSGVPFADVEAAVVAAMATWSSVVDITWNYLGNAISNPDPNPFGSSADPRVNIYWDAGNHGDGANFDGRWDPGANNGYGTGNVLAHGWAPPDLEHSVFDGNIHLDASEIWVTSGAPSVPFPAPTTLHSAAIDIQSIVLHELGHSLGLGHTNVQGAVMYPYYSAPLRTLGADDIAGIQSLYAAAGGPVGQVPEPNSLLLVALGVLVFRRSRWIH